MKTPLLKELPILAIIALPFIYLAAIWKMLPAIVPVHWNLNGQVDGYGSKFLLVLIPILLPLLTYLILSFAPKLDSENKFEKMGAKYFNLKLLITTALSALALIILKSTTSAELFNPNYIVALIGFLFLVLGNYFKTIQMNRFIGIRTPSTLSSEVVWKKTHLLGGKMWFSAGLVIILGSFFLPSLLSLILLLSLSAIIIIVPAVYASRISKD